MKTTARQAPLVLGPEPILRALWRRKDARIGMVTFAVLLVLTAAGPWLAGDPNTPDYAHKLAAPSLEHLLGTDSAGRDLLARSLYATTTSLGAALLVSVITCVIGLAVGVAAGVLGGVVDVVLARLIDVLLGLPGLVLTLAIVGLLGPGYWQLILAMSLSSWAGLARVARVHARSAIIRPDVTAARMAGVGSVRIGLGHVLPGTAAQVLILATLGIGEVVLSLAGLSFLGLGAQPPTAEWGTMLSNSRETLGYAPWQILGPATGLVATVLSTTLISEALRDVADPREVS